MKFKTTKKSMMQSYSNILSIGYCDAEYLLSFYEPIAYSAGIDGWNCDYYLINNVLISTGYQPIKSKNYDQSYDLTDRYNNLASKIKKNHALPWQEQQEKIDLLLKEYLELCKLKNEKEF